MCIKKIKIIAGVLMALVFTSGCMSKYGNVKYNYISRYDISNSYSNSKDTKLFQAAYRGDLEVLVKMLNSGANTNQLVSRCDFKQGVRECDKNYSFLGRNSTNLDKKTIIDAIFDLNPINYKAKKENLQLNIAMLEKVLPELKLETIRHYYLNNNVSSGSDFWTEEFVQKHQLLLSKYDELNGWSKYPYIKLERLYNYNALPFTGNSYPDYSDEVKKKALDFLKLYVDKVISKDGGKYEDELLKNAIKYADMEYHVGGYVHFMTIKNHDTTVANYKKIFDQEKEKFLIIKNQKEVDQKNILIKNYNDLLQNKQININNIYSVSQIDQIRISDNGKYYFRVSENFIKKEKNKLKFSNIYNSTGMIIAGTTTSKLEEFTNKVLSQVTTQLIVDGYRKLNSLKEGLDVEVDDNTVVVIEIDKFNKKLQKSCTHSNLDRIFQSDEKNILNYRNAECYKNYVLDNSKIHKIIIINPSKQIITNIVEFD